jgi:hypothetical protein
MELKRDTMEFVFAWVFLLGGVLLLTSSWFNKSPENINWAEVDNSHTECTPDYFGGCS